eukprot:TRINITY_DN16462_c0_g1_i1.p1 TRINITY_DN16462_c0_g1~~TRINITY_DN16462_c0_g1_i1.p1  ORF type:complete len:688 (+),score=72.87 TRINITY_DN16462_c0_g1_i1:67-2064(+)
MSGVILRQNLLTNWGDSVIYCSPGVHRGDALWVVSDGQWDTPTEILLGDGSWAEDEIVELSVSCNGYYLMVRGIRSCTIAELPDGKYDFADPLPASLLYEDIGVSETQWHPTVDEYLYALFDNQLISVYNTMPGHLYGVVTLPMNSPTLSFTTIHGGKNLGAFCLVTGTVDGRLDIHLPVVPPGACIPSDSLDFSKLDVKVANEIRNKIKNDDSIPGSEMLLTIDPTELEEGHIDVPFSYEVARLPNPVVDIFGKQVGNEIFIITSTETDITIFKVNQADGVGSSLQTLPMHGAGWGININLDKPRFSFGNTASSVIAVHPCGQVKISFEGPEYLQILQSNAKPLVYSPTESNTEVVLGVVPFTDLHIEQQYAVLICKLIQRIPSCFLVLSHVEECGQSTRKGSKVELPCAPAAWESWADKATTNQAMKIRMVKNLTTLLNTPTDLGLEDAVSFLKMGNMAVGRVEGVVEDLSRCVKKELKDAEMLQIEAHRHSVDMEAFAVSKSKSLLARVQRLRSKITSPTFIHPSSVTSAINATLLPFSTPYLPRFTLEPSLGALRAHLYEAGLTSAPYEVFAGKDCVLLQSDKNSPTWVVMFPGEVKLEVPPSVLKPAQNVAQSQQWEESIKLANKRDEAADRSTEAALCELNGSLKKTYCELSRSVCLKP